MDTPFHAPAFRRLWVSTVFATGALGIERTLTAWLALQLGADPFLVGLTFAARMLPSLLFGLPAGTLADQFDRSRQLAGVASAAALLMAGFGGVIALTGGTVDLVVLFSFLAGGIMVFDTPARQALVLDAAPPETAQRALALNALAGRLTSAFGALIGGALIAAVGTAIGYLVVAALYVLVGVLTLTLRVPQAQQRSAERPPFRTALLGSLRMIAELPAVRLLIIVGLICEIFAFSHLTAVPLFAQEVLQAGPEGLGALNAAQAIGGALAVALLALLPERIPRQPLLGAVFTLYGVAIIGFGLSGGLAVAALFLVITGFCAGAFDVLQQTLMQLAVPPEQRGRAVGLWVLSIGSAPIGHLEMGALAAALGVAAALLINGGLTLLTAVLLLAIAPDYRWRKG